MKLKFNLCRNPSFHGSGFTTKKNLVKIVIGSRNPSFHGSGFTTMLGNNLKTITELPVAILVFMEAGLLHTAGKFTKKLSTRVAILVFMEAGLLLEQKVTLP